MSDWVVDTNPQNQNTSSKSDWVVDTNPESFGEALSNAPGRVWEDVSQAALHGFNSLPGYWNKAKTEVPGIFNIGNEHASHFGKQALAGLSELGQGTFNLPHNIVNYLSDRLHLIPEDINKNVQMGRMPSDTQNMINKTFGEPQYPGEALTRGITRNSLGIIPGAKAASVLNPLNLTNKGISKNVVREMKNQVNKHTEMYNDLWKSAEKKGFNEVPIDSKMLNSNYTMLDKFYPEKATFSLKQFLTKPTLENAQKAQSDLGHLRRSLEEKAKKGPLLEGEKEIYKTLSNSEKHIEGNMFKNARGEINNELANRYKKISNSYRENVVPYKYNSDIQDYMSKKITAKQLRQRLNEGEFAAKKGGKHPAFMIRNAIMPTALGIGTLGGGTALINALLENKKQGQ